jgi:hypothetical protein
LFGLKEKVKGKKVKGKNVNGKKVNRKWVECEMIFRLFGMNESEKKVKGKKDVYLVNDTNTTTL